MKNKTMILIAVILSTGLAAIYASGQVASAGDGSKKNAGSDTAIPLKEAKLIIEHNVKDKDTGFQGFLDSEGWNRITVTGPDGKVLNLKGEGELGQLGLTELFFETVEPANADVPIDDVLETLPEGDYTFEGSAIEAGEKQGETIGTALLTHDIPEGPELLSPAEDAESFVYKKDEDGRKWRAVSNGLPEPEGTTITIFVSNPMVSGEFYAVNNRGLFRSTDSCDSWKKLDIPWPKEHLPQTPCALAISEG